jgi:cytochrome c biogenesis protein CcdA
MMITFLGYLLVFGAKDKGNKYIFKTGLIYILSVFVTYLMLGLMFYGLAYYLQRLWIAAVFKYIVGGALVIAGLIQLKDVFWIDLPIHLRMPKSAFEKLSKLMAKTSTSVTILIGVLTTVFSTPCMLPLYVGTTAVIAQSGLGMVKVLGLFLYYNLIFVLPLLVILTVMSKGKQIVEVKEWEHKNTKWMRFVLGFVLVAAGLFISLK